jgi:hypothetical protein
MLPGVLPEGAGKNHQSYNQKRPDKKNIGDQEGNPEKIPLPVENLNKREIQENNPGAKAEKPGAV